MNALNIYEASDSSCGKFWCNKTANSSTYLCINNVWFSSRKYWDYDEGSHGFPLWYCDVNNAKLFDLRLLHWYIDYIFLENIINVHKLNIALVRTYSIRHAFLRGTFNRSPHQRFIAQHAHEIVYFLCKTLKFSTNFEPFSVTTTNIW